MLKTKLGKIVAGLGLAVAIANALQTAEVLGKSARWVALVAMILSVSWLYLSKLLAAQDPGASPDA